MNKEVMQENMIIFFCLLFISFHFRCTFGIEVTGPPATTRVSLGSTAVLSCFVIDQSYENVAWSKIVGGSHTDYFVILPGGVVLPNQVELLPDKNDYVVAVYPVSSTDYWANMTIATVDSDDPGQYSCWTGTHGDEADVGELVLAVLPLRVAISDSSESVVEVTEGVAQTLTCTAYNSKPQVSMQWTINDLNVATDSTNFTKNSDGTFTTDSAMTYTYKYAKHHEKSVECFTTNGAGNSFTTIKLNILVSPSITNPYNDEFADEGGEVVLRCEAEGNPPVNFTWAKGTTVIIGGENHTELHVSDPDGINRYSTLTITSVDPGRDSGDYTCYTSNPLGDDIHSINLRVKTVPKPATGADVTEATDTELTVTWVEGQDGGHPQTFTVEYRVYGSGEDWEDSRAVNNPPVILNDLQPFTQYEIQVRSENLLGSVHGQSFTANTTATPITKAGSFDPRTSTIIGVVVGLVLLFGSILLSLILCKRYSVTGNDMVQCITCKKQLDDANEPQYARPDYKHIGAIYTDLKTVNIAKESSSPIYSDVESRNWEFARDRLVLKERVGSGAFGQVWRAEARNIAGNRGRTIVAVKTLKDQTTEVTRKDLLSELEFMKLLSAHPNVVSLLGCCTQRDPIYVIVEFVPFGNLQKYLRDHRSQSSSVYGNIHKGSQDLTPMDLISFASNTAKGMAYLSSMKCIHRDLAARNVLVGENKICKVADFGFARDVLNTGEYEKKTKGRLPLRWMALESLVDSVYTLKSDVWSFGVLLWEIVTMGSSPYPGMTGGAVIENLRDGYRMPKPKHCSQQMYNLMLECWESDQKKGSVFLSW